jgi:hypothetical protein
MRRAFVMFMVAAATWVTMSAATDAGPIGTLSVSPELGSVRAPFVFTGTECFSPAGVSAGSWELFKLGEGSVLIRDTIFPDADGVWQDGIQSAADVAGVGEYRLEARCEGGGYDYATATFIVFDPRDFNTDPEPPPPTPAPQPLQAAPSFTG